MESYSKVFQVAYFTISIAFLSGCLGDSSDTSQNLATKDPVQSTTPVTIASATKTLGTPTSRAKVAAIPALGPSYEDPEGRFMLLYPDGWNTLGVTPYPGDGVYLLSKDLPTKNSRWLALRVLDGNLPENTISELNSSERIWGGDISERGQVTIGTENLERHRTVEMDPAGKKTTSYEVVLQPWGTNVFHWTAHPGDSAEMIDLLSRVIASVRVPGEDSE